VPESERECKDTRGGVTPSARPHQAPFIHSYIAVRLKPASFRRTSFACQRKIPDSPKRDFSPVPASCPQRTRAARTEEVYHIPFARRKRDFHILPTPTRVTFMETHQLPVGKPPSMRMSGGLPCAWSGAYHAHVRGCTMRMVGGLPCACQGVYHAHVRRRTMRMSEVLPCAWSGVYHAHGRGLTMRMSGGVPCLGVAQGMARRPMSMADVTKPKRRSWISGFSRKVR